MVTGTTESLNILIKAKDLYSKELTKMQNSFKVSGAAIAGSMLVVGGILAKITKDTAALGDQFQKMSIRTNVSTQTLSEMAHVAELAGTSIQTIEKGIFRMTKVANDADRGLSTATETLDKLGISAKDTNGQLKNTEQLFFESIQALRQVDDETQRVALAQEIFGKSGVQLLTIVNETNESIRNQRKEARELGITFDQISANEAAKFNDDMTRLTKSVKGLTYELGKGLIPILAKSASGWVEIIKETKEFLGISQDTNLTIQETKKLIYQKQLAAEKFERLSRSASFLDRGRYADRAEDLREEIDLLEQRLTVLKEQRVAPITGTGEVATKKTKAGETKLVQTQEQFDAEMSLFVKNLDAELLAQQMHDEELRATQIAQDEFMEEARQNDLAAAKRTNMLRQQAAQNTAQGIVSIMEAMNTLADGKNRALFDALKVARASQAIVDTYAAANNALATVPYPYNFVAAGTVIAAGLANLAVISQTQFGSTSSGGGTVTAPSLPTTPSQTGITQPTGGGPTNITIEINNPLATENWNQLAEDEILPAINNALERNQTTLAVR